jgi:tetratricopeptide (TPR) repeat protein
MTAKTIKTDSLAGRILLIGIGLLCLVVLFFAARWFFGNAVAARPLQQEIAEFAVRLGPSDPRTHYAAAVLYEQSLLPEDLPKALAEYERAAALSPHDYRLWLAYGKALERSGDPLKAEQAVRKALELAPNYAEVHWVYGNILLRQGKNTEAFTALRRAVEGDPKYAGPAASTAWDIFENDIETVKKNIGNSAPVQVALAVLLAGQKRFDEALKIWNGLPPVERRTTFREDGRKIFDQLIANKKYRPALQVKAGFEGEKSPPTAVGRITNGGFEGLISPEKPEVFQWEIAAGNEPRIGISEDEKHAGEKSLTLIFSSAVNQEFRSVTQTVAVESGREYEFRGFYKSSLETSATLKWEIVDTVSGGVLAATEAIENQTNWKDQAVNFTTSAGTEGVIIRLVREQCTSTNCSISGTVWFDDLSLNVVNGGR